jgi:hypothetical protein
VRIKILETGVILWLSASDTYGWANRPRSSWPCSVLAGHRLFAVFDEKGLVDLTIDGKDSEDVDVTEFNAITSDFLEEKLPSSHPAHFVTVGQFK